MNTASSEPAVRVNTRKVVGRRKVRYESLDDLLADAQRLAAGEHRTLGNWSLGQILAHIGNVLDMGIDGSPINAPWLVRGLARLLVKRWFLSRGSPPGFKLPERARRLLPPPVSTEEGLERLRAAVDRWRREPQRAMHPLFGKISRAEWDTTQLRHAELHMSFVVPA